MIGWLIDYPRTERKTLESTDHEIILIGRSTLYPKQNFKTIKIV